MKVKAEYIISVNYYETKELCSLLMIQFKIKTQLVAVIFNQKLR